MRRKTKRTTDEALRAGGDTMKPKGPQLVDTMVARSRLTPDEFRDRMRSVAPASDLVMVPRGRCPEDQHLFQHLAAHRFDFYRDGSFVGRVTVAPSKAKDGEKTVATVQAPRGGLYVLMNAEEPFDPPQYRGLSLLAGWYQGN